MPMHLLVDARGLRSGEQEILRTTAADPRSDWIHAFSIGQLVLTDQRLCFGPFTALGGTDLRACELPLDGIERVSTVPVPIWVLGLVRIWLRGIRVVCIDGRSRTLMVGSARAPEWVTSLDRILTERRKTTPRMAGAASN
jgi:hypothetical protein